MEGNSKSCGGKVFEGNIIVKQIYFFLCALLAHTLFFELMEKKTTFNST